MISADPSESDEPVTVEVGGTFFQIPESRIEEYSMRVPAVRNMIAVNIGQERYLLESGLKEHEKYSLEKGGTGVSYNDTITIYTVKSVRRKYKPASPEVLSYLRSIASKKAPDTWGNDIAIARMLDLYRSACEFPPSKPFTVIVVTWFSNLFGNTEVEAALKHRNSAIRIAAAQYAKTHRLRSEAARAGLLNMASTDKVTWARFVAASALIDFAKDDRSQIPELRKILGKGGVQWQRERFASDLSRVDPNFVEYILPLIKGADIEMRKAIRAGLVSFVIDGIKRREPATYDAFSSSEKSAIQALMLLLQETDDPLERLRIVAGVSSFDHLIFSTEYHSVLDKMVLDENIIAVALGVERLKKNGHQLKNIEAVIANLERIRDKDGNKHEVNLLNQLLKELEGK